MSSLYVPGKVIRKYPHSNITIDFKELFTFYKGKILRPLPPFSKRFYSFNLTYVDIWRPLPINFYIKGYVQKIKRAKISPKIVSYHYETWSELPPHEEIICLNISLGDIR